MFDWIGDALSWVGDKFSDVGTAISEAVWDVMLELSAAQPEDFFAVDKHTLLRFSLGEPSFKQFVIVSGSDPPPEREIR